MHHTKHVGEVEQMLHAWPQLYTLKGFPSGNEGVNSSPIPRLSMYTHGKHGVEAKIYIASSLGFLSSEV